MVVLAVDEVQLKVLPAIIEVVLIVVVVREVVQTEIFYSFYQFILLVLWLIHCFASQRSHEPHVQLYINIIYKNSIISVTTMIILHLH